MSRELIIKLNYEIGIFNFANVLTEIFKVYKDVTLTGWLNPFEVVKIEGENYKVIPKGNTIVLRLTRNKAAGPPKRPAQIVSYEKHCRHLELLRKLNK